ncbi:MAG: hypothetical protein A2Y07_10335 [Planctomycetes bacterium GWF2_50_10]|nr:MAG: hypothetical protein A2Y07_10335 [Planctomycetes bacterium GWF2_50_10]
MTNKIQQTEQTGAFLEWLAIAVCLALAALRATTTQAPGVANSVSDNVFNVAGSFVLLAMGLIAFIFAMTRKFNYRPSWIEAGFAVFAVAAVISAALASNKRWAINETVMLTGPIIMAILLVQLLTTPARIKAVLYVIAALGAVNAVECIDQVNSSNNMVIQQYQEDPNSVISRLNIEPGSYQHMLFEHRLYSKDVRGFFTTGNSAGSFFILALAACAALILEKRLQLKAGAGSSGELAGRIIVAAGIILGLVLTHSKGALAAAVLAAALWALWAKKGAWLASHKWSVLVTAVVAVAAVFGAVIIYGLKTGTLPGGNSILVRWQYWTGATKILAAHPLVGIGGGNFATYYQLFKDPAALETVKDPHNFVLSLLAQYGPVGLFGFLAALGLPITMILFSRAHGQTQQKNGFKTPMFLVIILICIVMAAVRPMLSDLDQTAQRSVIIFVMFWLYGLPIIILLAALWMLSMAESLSITARPGQMAIVCGIFGVIVHNLIDFAIFEPGVYTALWLMIAVVISISKNAGQGKTIELCPGNIWGSAGVLAGFGVLFAATFLCLGPVVRSSILISSALNTISPAIGLAQRPKALDATTVEKVLKSSFASADANLARAATEDKYSAEIPAMNGSLAMQVYELPDSNDIKLLEWARDRFLLAAQRDRADFKNYNRLAEVFTKLADAQPQFRKKYLTQAAIAIDEAIKRYPGSDQLWFEAGKIAQLSGDLPRARSCFAKAVEIEDAYRLMFARMYPGRELFSRLGQAKYEYAKSQMQFYPK